MGPVRSIRVEPPGPGRSRNRLEWRKRGRTAFRIVWVLWALFWLAGGIGAAVENAPTEAAGETATFVAFALTFGLAPLACHVWWARHHPIVDPAATDAPETHDDHLRSKLAQITAAADELTSRGWSTAEDRRAIAERVARLEVLVRADEQSMERGGRRSPVIGPEIDQLRERVLGILDAAINSAAVAPGDSELDQRLQTQLDSFHARQRAVNEVEGRTQPGW